ncbi:hypothetical protein [Faecalispora jeddahensis]|nr:hypothetical protein [Faecalispora jeddahensis]
MGDNRSLGALRLLPKAAFLQANESALKGAAAGQEQKASFLHG